MRNAIILHGKPKKERYFNPDLPKPHKANWLPWLADRLQEAHIITQIPAFPEPYAPQYDKWKRTFEQLQISEYTGAVAHSAGAGFILRWLTENPDVNIERAVLVAPWHDAAHEYGKDFFDYTIDRSLSECIGRLTIFNSTDDGTAVQKSVAMLREAIPAIRYREFEGYGHFMIGNAMTTPQFPELLRELQV